MSYCCFLVLLLAPVLTYYGIDKQWTLIFMDAGSASLLLWLLVATLRRKKDVVRVPGLLPLGLFLLFLLLQLLPLPPVLLKLLSPNAFEHYQSSVWLLNPNAWMPLTIHAKATLVQLIRFTSYSLVFILTAQILNSPDRLRRTIYILTLFGGGYAFLSLLQKFVTGKRIFWFLAEWADMEAHGAGSYANYNHHAGLLEMLFPLVLVYFLLLGAQREQLPWRERLAALLKSATVNHYFLSGSAALLIFVAIMFSLSRGGTISLLLATLVLLVLLISSQKFKGKSFLVLLLVICAFGLVTEFGWQPIIQKFSGTFNERGELNQERPQYWLDSLNTIADYPVFGTGAGSFQDAYTRYQTVPTGTKYVRFAHNDYVELLTDTGLIGAGLVVWFLFSLLRQTWTAWTRRRGKTSIYIYLGSLCGVVAILLHSVTDFNLKIPPNGQFFFFLLGLMVVSANLRSRANQGELDLPVLSARQAKLLVAVCGLFLVAGLFVNAGGLYAGQLYDEVRKLPFAELDQEDGLEALQKIQRAALFDPLEARYPYTEAKLLAALSAEIQTLESYGKTLQLRPYRGRYIQKAGVLAASLGEDALAGVLLKTALKVQPTFFERNEEYARWLFEQQRTDEALSVLQGGLLFYPQETKNVLVLLTDYQLEPDQIRKVLPESALSWQFFAEYLVANDNELEAENAFRQAISFANTAEKPTSSPYWAFNRYLLDRNRESEALDLILAGIEQFPADARFRRTAGLLYAKQGIAYRAIEEYQVALRLNPGDALVKKKLEELTGEDQ